MKLHVCLTLRQAFLPLVLLALSTGCTRSQEEKSTLRIQLPGSSSSQKVYSSSSVSAFSWTVSDPSTMSDILCYAVAVGGTTDLNSKECKNSDGTTVFRAGVMAGLFKAGSDIELQVPSGKGRKIYLIGFGATSINECLTMNASQGPSRSDLSAPHVVASTTADLSSGDVRITMNASLTGATKFDDCTGLGVDDGVSPPPPPPPPAPLAQIVTAANSTCGILTDGKLNCWGNNFAGQLGDGTTDMRLSPTLIDGGSEYLTVAHGNSNGPAHTCAIATTGALKCWGGNAYGQVGDGTTTERHTPVVIDSGTQYLSVSVAGDGSNGHTCGVTSTNVLKCWGSNAHGQLGDGTTTSSLTPITVEPSIASVSTGNRHTCAITMAGVLKCWGENSSYGQLGTGNNTNYIVPTVIDSGVSYSQVSTAYTRTCGVTTSNVLKCWGHRIGNGTTSFVNTPTIIDGGTAYGAVGSGPNGSCAITTAGVLKCWGINSNGSVGDGTMTDRLSPVVVDSGTAYLTISTGNSVSCGMTAAGDAKCWGSNGTGAIGNGTQTDSLVPTLVIQ